LRKVSTYPLVCLRFSQTLLHQDLGTFLRKKSLNLGLISDKYSNGSRLSVHTFFDENREP
jgi:hypothetical protein